MKAPPLRWRPARAGIEFFELNGNPIPAFPVAPGSSVAGLPSVRLLEELWGRNLVEDALMAPQYDRVQVVGQRVASLATTRTGGS